MTVYKMTEKQPDKDQYCFVKNKEEWIFCMYQGNAEQPDLWGFFRNPTAFNLGVIEEWQPAYIQISNPSVDIVGKKVIYDLVDVKNGENASFWNEFKNTVGEPNGNDCTGSNCNPENRRSDVSPEVPVLRADDLKSAQCTVGCIDR